jgi:hypothetical protein
MITEKAMVSGLGRWVECVLALRNKVPLKLPLVFFDFLKSLNLEKIEGKHTSLRIWRSNP